MLFYEKTQVIFSSLLRTYLKSFSLSQKTLVFEHCSAVYIQVNEQQRTKKRCFLAKIIDFKQVLNQPAPYNVLLNTCNVPIIFIAKIPPNTWVKPLPVPPPPAACVPDDAFTIKIQPRTNEITPTN